MAVAACARADTYIDRIRQERIWAMKGARHDSAGTIKPLRYFPVQPAELPHVDDKLTEGVGPTEGGA